MVEKIVDRALSSLTANGVEVNRENWFQEAIEAEKSGAVHCCQAIIKAIIENGVEEEDRKQCWIDDAEFVSGKNNFLDFFQVRILFHIFLFPVCFKRSLRLCACRLRACIASVSIEEEYLVACSLFREEPRHT